MKFSRKFFKPESTNFNPADAAQVKKEFERLLKADPKTVEDLQNWIGWWEELGSALHDAYSRAHVAVTVNTQDVKAEEHYMKLASEILPLLEVEGFKLSQKLLNHPQVTGLPSFYSNYLRATRADVELFRVENVALNVEEKKLVNEYDKINGAMMVKFRGNEMTMQQLAKFLEDTDATTRKEAYAVRKEARLKVAPELNDLYGRMLVLREKIAKNAGFKNYRDYQFKAMKRFDYTADDCFKFHDAIEKVIVPVVAQLHAERIQKLGVKTLKPWDTQVNPDSAKAITPFKDVEELIKGCQKIFHKVDSEIGAYFDDMIEKQLLDLDSRKGKSPGGYCTQFSEERVPFIFMNAAGTKRDVETLLHEGGHSFHYYLAREIPLASYHSTGLEFAEVASMSMELLSRPYLEEFYDKETIAKVRDEQMKKVLEFFPFMAMIDAFQHWVYTAGSNGGIVTDSAKWSEKWSELEKRFNPVMDWSGNEDVRAIGWQYPHAFWVPFYYVEYGIAQLGALTVWTQSLQDYKAAVSKYKSGLRLGGTKTLPELFSSIGGKFGMDQATVKPLVDAVKKEIHLN